MKGFSRLKHGNHGFGRSCPPPFFLIKLQLTFLKLATKVYFLIQTFSYSKLIPETGHQGLGFKVLKSNNQEPLLASISNQNKSTHSNMSFPFSLYKLPFAYETCLPLFYSVAVFSFSRAISLIPLPCSFSLLSLVSQSLSLPLQGK